MKYLFVVVSLLIWLNENAQGIKISALPSVTDTPALSVVVPCVENAITKKLTLQRIKDAIGGSNSWSLTGNAGTDPNTNFIGTTDGIALNISSGLISKDTADLIQMSKGAGNSLSSISIQTIDNSFGIQNYINFNTRAGGIQINSVGLNHSSFINIDTSSIYINTVNLKIVDGTQSNGYVLTSDASGNATWQAPYLLGEDSLDFGNIAPNGHQVLTIAVTGAELSDVVTLGIPNASMNDHASYVAWISATDTVSVKCFNFDGSSFNPAIGLFKVKVIK